MKKYQVIEVCFTLMLFTLFVVGGFFILLYGSSSYQTMIEKHDLEEQQRLPLAYISTKIHHNKDGNMDIEVIEDVECFVIYETFHDKEYKSIFFYKDGNCYELFALSDEVHLKSAKQLFEVPELTMNKEENGFRFTSRNINNETQTLFISHR